jgi:hypothetical protein
MTRKIKLEAVVEFEGSAEELKKLAEALQGPHIVVRPKWPWPGPFAGPYPPAVLDKLRATGVLDKVMTTDQRVWIGNIRGGITPAHLHLGDEAVLLSKEAFHTVVREAAAEAVSIMADHMSPEQVTETLGQLWKAPGIIE